MTESKWPFYLHPETVPQITDELPLEEGGDGPSLEKPSTIKDKILVASYRGQPCLICESEYGTVAHHVTTVGAGGHDTTDNLMPLCQTHHREAHDSGRSSFFEKYYEAQQWAEYHCREDILDEI